MKKTRQKWLCATQRWPEGKALIKKRHVRTFLCMVIITPSFPTISAGWMRLWGAFFGQAELEVLQESWDGNCTQCLGKERWKSCTQRMQNWILTLVCISYSGNLSILSLSMCAPWGSPPERSTRQTWGGTRNWHLHEHLKTILMEVSTLVKPENKELARPQHFSTLTRHQIASGAFKNNSDVWPSVLSKCSQRQKRIGITKMDQSHTPGPLNGDLRG